MLGMIKRGKIRCQIELKQKDADSGPLEVKDAKKRLAGLNQQAVEKFVELRQVDKSSRQLPLGIL